jgi:predicted transcriptional regulator of viral defense system
MYRLNELIKLGRKIYHSNDLALLWDISNKNTLYTTIKRDVQKGVLLPIYKGLYSTVPLSQLDPLELGKAIIHRYAYLSTESVLAQAGVIAQATYVYTFVSNRPKKVSVGKLSFLFRQLKEEYLNNPTGILYQNGVFVASTERAVADMLYFNPKYHFDVPASIDFIKVKSIQKEVGYPC